MAATKEHVAGHKMVREVCQVEGGSFFWDCLNCGTPEFAEVTEVVKKFRSGKVPGIGLRILLGCHS